MQQARLFDTIWGSPCRALLVLALIGVFAALVFGLGATPALADDPPPKPNPVTDAKVDAVSDTQVTVSWAHPTAGDCPVTEYAIYMYGPGAEIWTAYRPSDGGYPNTDQTRFSYTIIRLSPNADYRYEVYAGSLSCRAISTPVSITFTTTGGTPGAAATPLVAPSTPVRPPSPPSPKPPKPPPVEPPEPVKPPASKKPSKRPSNLTFSGSDGSVTISWTAPKTRAGRCALSSYTMYIGDRTDPIGSGFVPVRRQGISGTSTSVSGLTYGHKYGVYVAGYSAECKKHSPVVKKVYAHK